MKLLNGAKLSASLAASNKIDGPAGFFLASDIATAEYAAARREGGVLQYRISGAAMIDLTASGSTIQNIPPGKANLPGYEFFIPTQSFDTFNTLRDARQIIVTPAE